MSDKPAAKARNVWTPEEADRAVERTHELMPEILQEIFPRCHADAIAEGRHDEAAALLEMARLWNVRMPGSLLH